MPDLNGIQKLCTDLSNIEPEFVVGEIYGLRQWYLNTTITDSGRETGMIGHNRGTWDLAGVNHASCDQNFWVNLTIYVAPREMRNTNFIAFRLEHAMHEMFTNYPDLQSLSITSLSAFDANTTYVVTRDTATIHPINLPWSEDGKKAVYGLLPYDGPAPYSFEFRGVIHDVPADPHPIADPKCTCGFYAYTDVNSLHSNSTSYGNAVFGLVKAYGHVTQGTRGFRAEKAEVVALTQPQGYILGFWRPIFLETVPVYPPNVTSYRTLDELINATEPLLDPARKDES